MHFSRFTLFLSSICLASLVSSPHPLTAQEPNPRPTFVNENSDLNGDNLVDSEDLMIFFQDWGKAAEPEPLVEMVTLPAGSFLMGNSGSERDVQHAYNLEWEQPRRQVNIDYAFQMGKYEVTNEQFAEVLNWAKGRGYPQNSSGNAYNGGDVHHNGQFLLDTTSQLTDIEYSNGAFVPRTRNNQSMANHPVKRVTWYGAVAFCNWLSEKEGRSAAYDLSDWMLTNRHGGGYRLPSEAEWEYACRGSVGNPNRYDLFFFGDDMNVNPATCTYSAIRNQYMVWCGNTPPYPSGGWTSPVGSKLANDYGLHDMHGNVWEWCEDWWQGSYTGAPTDGSAWLQQLPSDPYRVIRGGDWDNLPWYCRSAYRVGGNPDWGSNIGVRVVLSSFPKSF